MTAPRLATLTALLAVAAGAAWANEPCPAVGISEEAATIAQRLAEGDSTATHALGSFADGDTIFVLMPRGPALIIPPDVSARHRGQIAADSASVLTFSATARLPKANAKPSPVWAFDQAGLIIVPRTAVAGIITFAHRGYTYVFLSGETRHSTAACAISGVTLLPSSAGLAIRTSSSAVKTSLTGSEAVIETAAATILVSPCCAERPALSDLDPRRVLDAAAFTAHVEGARFLGPGGWRTNWTSAALDAHARLRAGDLDEARAALAGIRHGRGSSASPAIGLLYELLHVDRMATGNVPAAGPEPTVREERARLRTAHAVLAGCRSNDFSALRPQRLAFIEVLPPSETLPPALAASLALCEAEYLLQLGEPRAAVARLRARDAPTEGPAAVYRLILDAAALRRAGQADLAKFVAARLAEALDDPAGPPDLRRYEPYLRTDVPLDPALVLRTAFDRRRTFGDFRLDFRLVSAATATADTGELVLRLDALRAMAARATEPALGLALCRLAARRLVAALAADEPAAAIRPLLALVFVRQIAQVKEFADFARDLALALSDLTLHAGLRREAGDVLVETLANWPPSEPLEGRQRDWLERLLRRYHALQATAGAAEAESTLWRKHLPNDAIAALRDKIRRDLEREVVVEAVVEKDLWRLISPSERSLFDRLRTLRFDP